MTAERTTPLRARHLIVASGGGGLGIPAAANSEEARQTIAVAARCAGPSPPDDTGMEMVIVPRPMRRCCATALSVWAVPGVTDAELTVRVAAVEHDGADNKERCSPVASTRFASSSRGSAR